MIRWRPISIQTMLRGERDEMRPLVILAATAFGLAIALSSGAEGSASLNALWTRAYLAVGEGEGVRELAALGPACSRGKRRKPGDRLYAAECLRWVGEQQLALDQFDAAAGSLTAAHHLYTEVLGALNPLSGETLHLMAEVYLERGDFRRAGLAMDRALAILVPVERRAAERCRTVYEAIEGRDPPAVCGGALYRFPSVPSLLEKIKAGDVRSNCEPGSCRLKFDTEQRSDGRYHRGFYFSGVRSGYGLETSTDGNSIWSGVYQGGSLNGYAVYIGLSEGVVTQYYAGGWKMGNRHGFGSYRYTNGDLYTGEFRDGVEHGEGEYVSRTGVRFSGSIVSAKLDGMGALIVPGLVRSEGVWENGEREGEGFDIYLEGLIEYRGEYVKSKPKGYGHIFVQGREVSAGEMDPEVGIGFGLAELPDGGTYIGQLRDGSPNGFGFEHTKGKNIITGIWADSQRIREWTEEDFAVTPNAD
jgi:hypothetical protein